MSYFIKFYLFKVNIKIYNVRRIIICTNNYSIHRRIFIKTRNKFFLFNHLKIKIVTYRCTSNILVVARDSWHEKYRRGCSTRRCSKRWHEKPKRFSAARPWIKCGSSGAWQLDFVDFVSPWGRDAFYSVPVENARWDFVISCREIGSD